MSSNRDQQITVTLLKARDPLARVMLTASQLARDALTPMARDLAAQISHAVGQIDEQLEHSLQILRGRSVEPPRTHEDGHTLLESIHDRMAPVLRAHGIGWKDGPSRGGPMLLQVDRDTAFQGALALLRTGIAIAGAEGRLGLSFASPDGRAADGIVLEVELGPGVEEVGEEVMAGPRGFAQRLGGSLEVEQVDASVRVALRFATADAS